ncbi:hypothetical protein Bbelb_117420 [Branchiostoma belcheri]|nr:hypothetical protein Bbelb_117420 [Branchiostoma belcheri]
MPFNAFGEAELQELDAIVARELGLASEESTHSDAMSASESAQVGPSRESSPSENLMEVSLPSLTSTETVGQVEETIGPLKIQYWDNSEFCEADGTTRWAWFLDGASQTEDEPMSDSSTQSDVDSQTEPDTQLDLSLKRPADETLSTPGCPPTKRAKDVTSQTEAAPSTSYIRSLHKLYPVTPQAISGHSTSYIRSLHKLHPVTPQAMTAHSKL